MSAKLDEFLDALTHCDTVKVILTGVGETIFATKEIYEAIRVNRSEFSQKVQQLERYAKGTLCIECMYHTSWENENWDIVHWCKAHAEQVTEDDFCSIGEHR